MFKRVILLILLLSCFCFGQSRQVFKYLNTNKDIRANWSDSIRAFRWVTVGADSLMSVVLIAPEEFKGLATFALQADTIAGSVGGDLSFKLHYNDGIGYVESDALTLKKATDYTSTVTSLGLSEHGVKYHYLTEPNQISTIEGFPVNLFMLELISTDTTDVWLRAVVSFY